MSYTNEELEAIKAEVRRNEMRELSASEERDPVETIPNFEYYAEQIKRVDGNLAEPEENELGCEDCDYVATSKRGLASHRRIHG